MLKANPAFFFALFGTPVLSQLASPLLDALKANGFAQFAQQIQNDPILTAGPGLIIYAPTDAALTSGNQTRGLVRRQTSDDLKQAENAVSAVDSTAPRPPKPKPRDPARNVTTRQAPAPVGSTMVTLLNAPPFVNLGPGRNQSIIEKGAGSGSFPSVHSGLGKSVKVTGADIPFAMGVIRPVDGFITLPDSVSVTLPFLGVGRFITLLKKSGLLTDLDARAGITILAPNDNAFDGFNDAGFTDDQLLKLLQEHVVVGSPGYTPLLENGDVYQTLAGGEVAVSVQNGVISLNGAKVVAGDAILRNGVVHTIDKVLGRGGSPSPSPSPSTGAAVAMRAPQAWEALVGGFAALVVAAHYNGLL